MLAERHRSANRYARCFRGLRSSSEPEHTKRRDADRQPQGGAFQPGAPFPAASLAAASPSGVFPGAVLATDTTGSPPFYLNLDSTRMILALALAAGFTTSPLSPPEDVTELLRSDIARAITFIERTPLRRRGVAAVSPSRDPIEALRGAQHAFNQQVKQAVTINCAQSGLPRNALLHCRHPSHTIVVELRGVDDTPLAYSPFIVNRRSRALVLHKDYEKAAWLADSASLIRAVSVTSTFGFIDQKDAAKLLYILSNSDGLTAADRSEIAFVAVAESLMSQADVEYLALKNCSDRACAELIATQ